MRAIEPILRSLIEKVHPKCACEVGVFTPDQSKILYLAASGVRCILVEPHPTAADKIREVAGAAENVIVVDKAVTREPGAISLVEAGASTFVKGVDSPAKMNDALRDEATTEYTVESVRFEDIDPGDIDVLCVDTEGSEWFVLQGLASRPAILVLELYGKRYVNPHIDEIRAWTRDKGYKPYTMDKSDVVFVRDDVIRPSLLNTLGFRFRLARVALRRFRYRIRKAFGT
jgi:FkbM family methyltransferase